MNRKERDRMKIMAAVKRKELSQVQEAELMGLGHRQARQVWPRCRDERDGGLVHRQRGSEKFNARFHSLLRSSRFKSVTVALLRFMGRV